MFSFSKIMSVAMVCAIGLPLTLSTDCEAARRKKRAPVEAASTSYRPIRQLPDNTITVGCCRIDCPMPGGNGSLMRGLHKLGEKIVSGVLANQDGSNPVITEELGSVVAALHEKSELQPHSHPGVTIDLFPLAEGVDGDHIEANWMELDLPERSIDCVFLEQLPPTGVISTHGEMDRSREMNDFLPRAIEKARTLLTPEGNLVIQLALDSFMKYDHSSEQLNELRQQNPFCGWFNDISLPVFATLRVEGTTGPRSLTESVRHYLKIMRKRKKELIKEAQAATIRMKDFTKKVLGEMIDDTVLNLSAVTVEDIKNPGTKDQWDIATTVVQLLAVTRQGEMMVDYLNSHGFQNAELQWLEANQHEFNPHAGWFLTAKKDSTYAEAAASASVGVEVSE